MAGTIKSKPEDCLAGEIKFARRDPYFFSERILSRFEKHPARHDLHALIQDFIKHCLVDHRSCVIQAPPEHGKSCQIIPLLCWLIGHDETLKIGLVSADHDLCQEHLIKARKILTGIFYRNIFPEIKPDYQRSSDQRGEWSKAKLYLVDRPDPCLEAYPLFGAAEGHRLDMIFADDCVTRSCLHSPTARRNVESALFDTFQDRLTDNGIMVVSNNCWHKDDVVHKMRASVAYSTLWIGYRETSKIYYQLSYPPKSWKGKKKGTFPLWDKVWPKERLLDRRLKNRIGYTRAFEARAVKSEDCRFPPMDAWARWKKIDKKGQLFGFLDPCGGTSARKGDYAALIVVNKRAKELYDVVDCHVGRFTAQEQIDCIFNMHRKWLKLGTHGFFRCEVEMLKKEENWLKIPFRQRQAEIRLKVRARIKDKKKEPPYWRVPLRVRNPKEAKESRIERIGPLLENGWLRWPENLEELILRDTVEGRSWALLVSMVEEWPFGDHDDGPDALSGAVDCADSRKIGGQSLVLSLGGPGSSF